MALAFHDRKAIAQQEEHQKIKEYGESINEETRKRIDEKTFKFRGFLVCFFCIFWVKVFSKRL